MPQARDPELQAEPEDLLPAELQGHRAARVLRLGGLAVPFDDALRQHDDVRQHDDDPGRLDDEHDRGGAVHDGRRLRELRLL